MELISKQQAIDAIAKQSRFSAEEIIEICDKSIQDENGWLGGLKEAIQAVIELPSIQPENEFLDFLWNVINPNDMEKYLSMYHSKEEKRNG